jgi:hypothetical protein
MKTIINYLDDLKEKLGSDYKIKKALNTNASTISMIRKRGQMSDETAIKIAHALEIDTSEVLLAATIARSDGEVKEAWEKISKRSGIAAGLFLPVSLALSSVYSLTERALNSVLCILC